MSQIDIKQKFRIKDNGIIHINQKDDRNLFRKKIEGDNKLDI